MNEDIIDLRKPMFGNFNEGALRRLGRNLLSQETPPTQSAAQSFLQERLGAYFVGSSVVIQDIVAQHYDQASPSAS